MNREVAVFSAARRLPAGERAKYLDEACAGDAALRQRVEELLRAGEEAGAFFQDPAQGAQRPAAVLPSTNLLSSVAAPGEKAGDRIGHYKLLQQIGQGGCGVVYMAEQEEPVRRRVALKVIKLGMDTKQVVARFEAERQALALMDHPNIAKVLEAGATDTGRPYFVMELVRGIKITHYCDEHNLSTRERLDLFIKVAQAVQHAHQKGIIHRDLKPSNVLVADHDGVPVPKVIDFGIAKATTDQRLTDKTLFTAFEQFIGTPAYMSPEQARMSGLDIDTRTDIYSLGVLLYELLTGKTPFDAQDLMAAGLEEMRRTIREKEPARPSTRLSTMLAADLSTVAKHRQCESAKLTNSIRGDLDWIVMKALEKDRARRYDTANGLAMDIVRHLDNEPILARPPTQLYRFQKMVRRNKLAFAAAALVTTSLVIGLGLSTWEYFKEREARQRAVLAEREQTRLREEADRAGASEAEQRRRAEAERKAAQTEAAKSQQVAHFLKDMLQGVGPSKALGRDTAMLREILDNTAERLGRDLTNQPEVELELRSTLASTYHELGLYQPMEAMARLSLRLAQSRPGRENEYLADALTDLADALDHLGKLDESEKFALQALEQQRELLGQEPSANRSRSSSLEILAHILTERGKFAESEATHREVLAIRRKLFSEESGSVAISLDNLAGVLLRQRKLAEAESTCREALAIRRKLFGEEHSEIAMSLDTLARVLSTQGKLAEAEALFRQALAMCRKFLGNENPRTATTLNNLGVVLFDLKKLAEAEATHREALELRRKLLGNEHPRVAVSLNGLARVLLAEHKLPEAETLYRDQLQRLRARLPADDADLARVIGELTGTLLAEQKFAEAEPLARECLAIRDKKLPDDWHTFNTRSMLGGALLGQKKYSQAESMLVSGYEGMKQREDKIPQEGRRRLSEALQRLVQFYEATDQPAQAAEWKKKLAESDTAEK